MTQRDSLTLLVDLAMQATDYTHMRAVITKELLHYDILFCLEDNGFLDELTFQGGTALRLCYGAFRMSEDLDFVGGYDFSTSALYPIKKCLEKYIGKRYSLEIEVKEPKELSKIPEYKDIKVDKWQVKITTDPGRRDLPKQKIKLEVANIPACSRSPKRLKKNYDFLPDGYSDTIVMVESLDEIMADKLVAFVACQKYIRYRDIWDLGWLKQQGAQVNMDYIFAKIKDYKEQNYVEKLTSIKGQISNIVQSKGFIDEMSRFVPTDMQRRTLKKDKFIELLINDIEGLFSNVSNLIGNVNLP